MRDSEWVMSVWTYQAISCRDKDCWSLLKQFWPLSWCLLASVCVRLWRGCGSCSAQSRTERRVESDEWRYVQHFTTRLHCSVILIFIFVVGDSASAADSCCLYSADDDWWQLSIKACHQQWSDAWQGITSLLISLSLYLTPCLCCCFCVTWSEFVEAASTDLSMRCLLLLWQQSLQLSWLARPLSASVH